MDTTITVLLIMGCLISYNDMAVRKQHLPRMVSTCDGATGGVVKHVDYAVLDVAVMAPVG